MKRFRFDNARAWYNVLTKKLLVETDGDEVPSEVNDGGRDAEHDDGLWIGMDELSPVTFMPKNGDFVVYNNTTMGIFFAANEDGYISWWASTMGDIKSDGDFTISFITTTGNMRDGSVRKMTDDETRAFIRRLHKYHRDWNPVSLKMEDYAVFPSVGQTFYWLDIHSLKQDDSTHGIDIVREERYMATPGQKSLFIGGLASVNEKDEIFLAKKNYIEKTITTK